MPKTVNDARVLASYERLQNGKAVARETGIHENTVYQVLRRAGGVCLRCGAPPVLGKTQCKSCAEFDRERIKQRRKERLRAGTCAECDAPKSPLSSMYCEAHRVAMLERKFAHKARKKALRGSPQGQAQSQRQKMRSLLDRFGQAGRDRWKHADGSCEICATRYGEEAIHVHHIDENPKNNIFENLICLCHACHVATHAILRLKRRSDLIAWLDRIYPS